GERPPQAGASRARPHIQALHLGRRGVERAERDAALPRSEQQRAAGRTISAGEIRELLVESLEARGEPERSPVFAEQSPDLAEVRCTMSLTAKPRASQARASESSSTHFSQRRVFGAEKASAPARASERSRKVANTAGTGRDYFAFSSASASATRRCARAAAASKSTRGGNPSRCATSSGESEVPA